MRAAAEVPAHAADEAANAAVSSVTRNAGQAWWVAPAEGVGDAATDHGSTAAAHTAAS